MVVEEVAAVASYRQPAPPATQQPMMKGMVPASRHAELLQMAGELRQGWPSAAAGRARGHARRMRPQPFLPVGFSVRLRAAAEPTKARLVIVGALASPAVDMRAISVAGTSPDSRHVRRLGRNDDARTKHIGAELAPPTFRSGISAVFPCWPG